MESRIASMIELRFPPVALLWSDERPTDAAQFAPRKWGCVMAMFASAARGKTAAFDRETFGCVGGGVGLGFGNQYVNFPGGVETFCRFLSAGIPELAGAGEGTPETGGALRRQHLDDFVHGERYLKTPELVRTFIEKLPMMEIPTRYALFKPLPEVEREKEKPVVVTFLADPDQLSALVVLANYARESAESVIIPFGAGCQTIGLYPYREAQSETPRAVVGLTDISARKYTRNSLGGDLLSFAVPLGMFDEMEANAEESFLVRETWRSLRDKPR